MTAEEREEVLEFQRNLCDRYFLDLSDADLQLIGMIEVILFNDTYTAEAA